MDHQHAVEAQEGHASGEACGQTEALAGTASLASLVPSDKLLHQSVELVSQWKHQVSVTILGMDNLYEAGRISSMKVVPPAGVWTMFARARQLLLRESVQ